MSMEKKCTKCGRILPLTDFYIDRGSPRPSCKECCKKKSQEWREANPDKVKAIGVAYRSSEAGAEKRRVWLAKRAKTPEQIEYQKQWAKTEKGKESRRRRVNRFAKTDKGFAANKRRHARRRAARDNIIATLTADEWKRILEKYDYRCAYCGMPFSERLPITQDHVIPISKGGDHTKENVVPACKPCNSRKKDKEL